MRLAVRVGRAQLLRHGVPRVAIARTATAPWLLPCPHAPAAAGVQRSFCTLDLPGNLEVDDPSVFEEPEEGPTDAELLRWDISVKELSVSALGAPDDEVTTVVLDNQVFGVPVRRDIVHRVVCWQRAKRRNGVHHVKTRAEVSGGGRKPWKQKGTGRARHGSTRSPIWRGGGKAHGPRQKDWEHKLNKNVRSLGLKCALAAKWREGNLLVVKDAAVPEIKTKAVNEMLKGHKLTAEHVGHRGVLMIDGDELDENFKISSGNLPHFNLLPARGANVYDIVFREKLVLTLSGLEQLTSRLLRKPGAWHSSSGARVVAHTEAVRAKAGVAAQ